MSAALHLRGVAATRGSQVVLHNVNLVVEEGAHLAVIGANGAGKTTLLRLLCGVLPCTIGTIELLQRDLSRISPGARANLIGYVPQLFQPTYSMPIEEFLALSYTEPRRSLFPDAQRTLATVQNTLEQCCLTHLRKRTVDSVSGGELRRILIASALVSAPRILLLDEPTAALDPRQKSDVVQLLEHLRSTRHLTIVHVTHDLEIIRGRVTAVCALKQGKIQKVGVPELLNDAEFLRELYDPEPQPEAR